VYTFLTKKRTSFFWPKIHEFHFFSVLESPAYISANRVGNFLYIEKRYFFPSFSIKFPTHFPDRYLGRQIFHESSKVPHFGYKKVTFCWSQKVIIFWSKKLQVFDTFIKVTYKSNVIPISLSGNFLQNNIAAGGLQRERNSGSKHMLMERNRNTY
jgi:hypothetical protein